MCRVYGNQLYLLISPDTSAFSKLSLSHTHYLSWNTNNLQVSSTFARKAHETQDSGGTSSLTHRAIISLATDVHLLPFSRLVQHDGRCIGASQTPPPPQPWIDLKASVTTGEVGRRRRSKSFCCPGQTMSLLYVANLRPNSKIK